MGKIKTVRGKKKYKGVNVTIQAEVKNEDKQSDKLVTGSKMDNKADLAGAKMSEGDGGADHIRTLDT